MASLVRVVGPDPQRGLVGAAGRRGRRAGRRGARCGDLRAGHGAAALRLEPDARDRDARRPDHHRVRRPAALRDQSAGGQGSSCRAARSTSAAGSRSRASRILLFGVAVVLALSLSAIYARTTFGLATTAVSERPRTLAALGWRIGMVGAVNWGVGGALAGLAGVLLSPIIGVSLTNGNVAHRHGAGRRADRRSALVPADVARRDRDRHAPVAVQHPRPRDHRVSPTPSRSSRSSA